MDALVIVDNLLESAIVVYHVTPISNLKKIQTSGLLPRRGPRARRLGEKNDAIYTFPSLTDVEDALGGWLGNEFSEDARLALLAVKLPEGVRTQSDVGYEQAILDPIAPENIRVLSRDLFGESDFKSLAAR